jgi:PAS domain S-box-containing protein
MPNFDNGWRRVAKAGSLLRGFWVLIGVCAGIAASIALCVVLRQQERVEFKSDFQRSADRVVNSLKREIDIQSMVLEGIAGLYHATDNVTREEFKSFVTRFAGRTQAVRSMEWIPRIADADRSSFEEKLRREGFPNFRITERNAENQWVTAGKRSEYFPVYRMEPIEGNSRVLGWDMGSNPDRLALIEKARDAGRMMATGKLALVRDDLREPSFLVVLPVYREGESTDSVEARRSSLIGFSRAVFRIGDLVKESLSRHNSAGLDVYVFDESKPKGEQLMYFHPSVKRGAEAPSATGDPSTDGGIRYDTAVKVAQREWLIRIVPSPWLLARQNTWLSWIGLLGGLLLTASTTGYILLLQRGSRNAIAARKAIEKVQGALMESEELFRSVIQTAGDAIISMDAEGDIILWNSGAERAFGYSAEEIVGKPATTIMPERFREAHLGALRRGSSNIEPYFSRKDAELAGLSKDGSEFPIELSVASWSAARGKFFTGIVRDISEQKTAERNLIEAREAAEQASRAKSEFLANMSHEIRTPINGIMGMTELALNTDLTAEQSEFLDAVNTSADSLLNLINDILDLSKIEAGKLELVNGEFSLRDTIADTMTILAALAHKKGLELIYDIPPEVADALIGDPGRIKQVLVNLAGNAVKFTHKGEVSVKVETDSEEGDQVVLRFSVSDTGIGIPADQQKRIFGAFEQADASKTRKYGGTGLGLSVSLRLVEMMGGRIWVESEPGQGSTFHFTARLEVQKQTAESPILQEAHNHAGLRVLVVDDNTTNRRILEKTLEYWGMLPTCVESGSEAIAAFQRSITEGKPFPLVLTDCMMPEMDGFELVERINLSFPDLTPSIIMLTSAGERGDAARCLNLAVRAYLIKPVKQADLLYAITNALNNPEAVADRRSLITRHTIRESKRRLRVLLAEDNPVNQKLAGKILEKMGHTVTVAQNGKEAVEFWAHGNFDMVFMDVQMPEMDGFQATGAIREKETGSDKRTPIVAMTAHALKGDEEQCLAAGMDDYVAKPIRVLQLTEVIDRLIGRVGGEENGPAPSGPRQGMIDENALMERVGGDKELLMELAHLFLEDAPKLVSEIKSSLDRNDLRALENSAHALKGSMGNFASKASVDPAFRHELMGGSGNLEQADEALADLEKHIAGVRKALLQIVCEQDVSNGRTLRGANRST